MRIIGPKKCVCGREIPKAKYVREGVAYCDTCYKREFKCVPCSKGCGRNVAVYHGEGPGVCKTCKNIGRICIRCKRKIKYIGMIAEDGPVCSACLPALKAPKPCSRCGTMSQHLARYYNLGITEPVCPKCFRAAGNQKTCSVCRKHREVAATDGQGNPLCRKCHELEGNPFICPKCGFEGRRHSNTECESCYWEGYIGRKVQEFSAKFKHEWTKKLLGEFASMLMLNCDSHRSAMKLISVFHIRFMTLDAHFEKAEYVTPDLLVAAFSTGYLRVGSTLLNFLVSKGILPKDEAKIRNSEILFRQRGCVNNTKGRWYHQLFVDYYKHLMTIHDRYVQRGWTGKNERFILPTISNYLSAAITFLDSLPPSITQFTQVQQDDVNNFAKVSYGIIRSTQAFIRFLNLKRKGFRKLTIASIRRDLQKENLLDDNKYYELLDFWTHPNEKYLKESLICLFILRYAQTAKKAVSVRLDNIFETDGDFRIAFGRTPVLLPKEDADVLKRYLAQRKAISFFDSTAQNPYLFPGLMAGGHLKSTTVFHYVSKHSVTIPQLMSTALYRAFLGGVNHPRTIADSFDVGIGTALKYYTAISPVVRDESEMDYAKF
jgi:hypothetical protein